MDAINIISGIALLLSIVANSSAAKGGLKKVVSKSEVKPRTFLQKTPLNISALVLILELLGVFQVGTLAYQNDYILYRVIGLVVFSIFSWLQVKSFKNLKQFYTQEISLQKNHQLVKKGLHKNIRHPQYISQIISDIGLGIALVGYLIVPIVILVEFPLFILRAKKEEEMMQKFFGDEYTEYKKHSGFMIPFIG